MKRRNMRFNLIVAVIVILLAAFMLTPRFYEPGGESWKQWASARIMRETGGFPVFSLGPAYVTYLQIFQFFNYPLSVDTEYVITHLFTYMAIFLMLNSFLPVALALMLTCAWIPNVATLEPGGLVAGIGFIALYLRAGRDSVFNRGYCPPSLLAALACHSAYLFFFVGNGIGVVLERYLARKAIFSFPRSLKEIKIFPASARIILLIILVLTLLFPSRRLDNNQVLSATTYVPVPINNPLSVTFFHIGNWKYAMRTTPQRLQIYQDWYFTNDVAFGGAKTILQAIVRRPDTVFANMLDSAVHIFQVPMRFLTGNFQRVLSKPLVIFFTVVSLILFPAGLIGMVKRFKTLSLIPVTCSVVIGSGAIMAALLLTWCSPRYVMTLLPVGLLMIANIGSGIDGLFRISHRGLMHINSSIIMVSAALVLFMVVYPEGRYAQIKAVLGNSGLLSESKPISMVGAHPALLNSLNKNSDVLAIEDTWIKAFTDVDLDRAHSVYDLPPFPDPSGNAEKMLEGLRVIWVSNTWPKPIPSVSTQAYLRYHLHVEPFLEKALAKGWTVEDVKYYGKIYKR